MHRTCVCLQNEDGCLSREEFIQGAKEDKWIFDALTISMTSKLPDISHT